MCMVFQVSGEDGLCVFFVLVCQFFGGGVDSVSDVLVYIGGEESYVDVVCDGCIFRVVKGCGWCW